jgi:hypothetical protein
VIPWNNAALPRILGSVIKKMYHSPVEVVEFTSDNRPYITMTEDAWFWTKVKWGKKFKLNYKTMPSEQPKRLILLKDFRGGVDGRVWLACTTKGEMCAIKFDHEDNKEALEREATHWREIWNIEKTQVITLGGKHALMMPYVKPPPDTTDPLYQKGLLKAVRTMASKGYSHSDLASRHVGIMTPKKKNEPPDVFFFDLRQLEEIEDEASAVSEMLRKLNIDESVVKKLEFD